MINTRKLGEGQGRTRTENCQNMLSPNSFAVIALPCAVDPRADSDKNKQIHGDRCRRKG